MLGQRRYRRVPLRGKSFQRGISRAACGEYTKISVLDGLIGNRNRGHRLAIRNQQCPPLSPIRPLQSSTRSTRTGCEQRVPIIERITENSPARSPVATAPGLKPTRRWPTGSRSRRFTLYTLADSGQAAIGHTKGA